MGTNIAFEGVAGAGTDEGMLTDGLLVPDGGEIKIIFKDKPIDVNKVIPGIHSIKLVKIDGKTYKYELRIDGECPKKKLDNKIIVTDSDGKSYTKKLYSETREVHTLNYNSLKPNIKVISWDI